MPSRQLIYATKPIGEAAAAGYRKGGEENPGLVPYFVRFDQRPAHPPVPTVPSTPCT